MITFRWKVSGMFGVEYEVYGHGPTYRVELKRNPPSDYERSITNYKGAEFDKWVTNKLGVLHCSCTGREYLGINGLVYPEVLEAFNLQEAKEHEEHRALFRSQWQRYFIEGPPTEAQLTEALPAPVPAVCGYWRHGEGWLKGMPANLEEEARRSKIMNEASLEYAFRQGPYRLGPYKYGNPEGEWTQEGSNAYVKAAWQRSRELVAA